MAGRPISRENTKILDTSANMEPKQMSASKKAVEIVFRPIKDSVDNFGESSRRPVAFSREANSISKPIASSITDFLLLSTAASPRVKTGGACNSAVTRVVCLPTFLVRCLRASFTRRESQQCPDIHR